MPAIQEAGIIRIGGGSWQNIERLQGGNWGGGVEELGSMEKVSGGRRNLPLSQMSQGCLMVMVHDCPQ